jgi:fatty-acyl-CoA synthase
VTPPGHHTLPELLTAAASRDPAGLAVADDSGGAMTWAEVEGRANRAARGLRAHGLARGDRVMTVIGERIEYAEVYAALGKAALVAVPVSWRYKPKEIRQIADDAEPAAIVFDAASAQAVHAAIAGLPYTPLLFEIGSGASATAPAWEEVGRDERSSAFNEARPEDIAILGYTSGTTGAPKGAIFDQRTCRLAAAAAAVSYGLPTYGAGVLTGSLSYATVAIVHLWAHVLTSSAVVLVGRFDLERTIHLVEQHRATFTYLPTPTIEGATGLLARRPAALDGLRSILVGASPISRSALEGLVEVAGDRVVQSYGMTESAGTPVCIGRRSDWLSEPEPYSCVGRVAPPWTLGLSGPGERLPHDGQSVGEIVARGPLMMRGYWRNEPGTAAAMEDGWLRTGDLGSISPDGRVTIKGRSKEVIISGGANVFPLEVENVLSASDRVLECAVVGVPDDTWGETPVAFVVVNGPADGIEEHVRSTCRESLADYKCPKRVVVLDELPRNANLKVLKHALVELATG